MTVPIPFTGAAWDLLTLWQFIGTFLCILFGMGWFPCCCAVCEQCEEGTRTGQVQIEISGVVNSPNCAEANCTDFNTTAYILNATSAGQLPKGGNPCCYHKFDNLPCQTAGGAAAPISAMKWRWMPSGASFGFPGPHGELTIWHEEGGDEDYGACEDTLTEDGALAEALFGKGFASEPFDCSASLLNIPGQNGIAGTSAVNCDYSSAIADATPL